jgi:Na+/melibiose symporter-like transporter
MSGRLSALWSVFSYIPLVTAIFASGVISERLDPGQTFFLAAATTLLIGLFAFWKPASVFSHTYENPVARASTLVADVKRLLQHRAIYPALLMNFLWYFMPGANTPLQFYLTNRLHASDAIYAYYDGIYLAANIPAFLFYGFICTRVPASKLLWWGTIIGIPSMIPLAFVDSASHALAFALPMGLMSGVGTAAYYDLTMRSCPPGLHGTLMMLVTGVWMLALRGGDVLGSKIYAASASHGFVYCVITMTAVYTLILPIIPLIPKQLIATADGKPNSYLEAAVTTEN